MERKFCINWTDIVCEAKQRRLSQKLTQKKLAKLAGVSTPTLSRFENDEKDIQLSSALRILGMLGLVDERQLNFLDEDAIYISERMVVMFWGVADGKRIKCKITHEALCDHYNGDDRDSLKVFKANRLSIE